ncbi:uncharacterized protein LOC123677883 [Harmonia axyridis]|uniref:uncharacterized protein LOC123677883 n=1 Tax=Harmonia axyridis TaxID=115357 RepID=UPI001E27847F|nr:uncharacterized protein LOC123677883 [Harmonia axyridis]
MMSTWTVSEIKIIQDYITNKSGPITVDDHKILQQTLVKRSLPSIKKKCLDLKHSINTNQPCRIKQSSSWTSDEERRLVENYINRNEKQVTKRIRAILNAFPGRTEKALATKLRDKYPEIYYGKNIPTENETQNVEESQAERSQQRDPSIESTLKCAINQTQDGDICHNTIPESDDLTTVCLKELNESELVKVRTKFDTLFRRIPKKKRNIKKFYVRPCHLNYIEYVDRVLGENISKIENGSVSHIKKRKDIKKTIYVAGLLLQKHILGKTDRQDPSYIKTEKKIKSLELRVKNAEAVVNWKGGIFKKQWKDEVEEMRKLKMKPKQYIVSTNDRIRILKEKAEHQRKQAQAQKIRYLFNNRPSMKILEKSVVASPESSVVTEHYTKMYTQCNESHETPIFNSWLQKFQKFTNGRDYSGQLEEQNLERIINEAITKTSPWKSPGEDCIPNNLYKVLPCAKEYLKKFIISIVQGKQDLSEADVRANIVLVHKKGDENDPANYRPIALLNTEYKILTSTIASILKNHLPEWAIPKEQLARQHIWGTIHGMLVDKSVTQLARMRRKKNYSAWYDFKKAYDSISHRQLKRLIGNLPLDQNIKKVLRGSMNLWSVQIKIGKDKTNPIYVKRGVYQGDSISPLLFILISGGIIEHIKTSPTIMKSTRGQHDILAFMDDIKCHANTKQSMKIITKELEKCSAEIGLSLNVNKCGIYSRNGLEPQEDVHDVHFLPEIREGYRYLGLAQLERDTTDNLENITEKIKKKSETIFGSNLTTRQKIQLFNSSIIPAAIYVLGNLFPEEKRATTLKNCRDLDTMFRKMLVDYDMKGKTTSNARVYLSPLMGGLGMKSVEIETEIHYIRKGIYLQSHPDMTNVYEAYKSLQGAGWRNPLSDCHFVLEKYGCNTEQYPMGSYKKSSDNIIKIIRKQHHDQLIEKWSENMNYGRIVADEGNKITFPAFTSPYMDSWRLSLLHSAAEEQLHGLGCIPGRTRVCRRGCGNTETAYHVTSSCPTNMYISRHDNVVHWLLKTILTTTNAPEDIIMGLQFGKATLMTDYEQQGRSISIRAGHKILTEKKMYHNKPDIMIKLSNPDRIILIEVAIAHIQNYRLQEKIKRNRYAVNSTIKIDNKNVDNVVRDVNIVGELEKIHRCPVDLGIFVVGCSGEMIVTEEQVKFAKILSKVLGLTNSEIQHLFTKRSYSVCLSTSQILLKHLNLKI